MIPTRPSSRASLCAAIINQAGRILWLLTALLVALAVVPSFAQAQGNYVYVNDQTVANSVNAYSVSSTGALTAVAGSPFSTGGVGAPVSCYGLNRITISSATNLMFVANTGNQTISVFQINPANGVLTLVPGSPFASGLTLDGCQGISLAVTPDGAFLLASSNGQIKTFSVAAGGALTPFASIANCCTPMAGMAISANGNFVAVSNENSVSVYTIAAGVLTPVAGSPFPKTGTGFVSGLDFSCAGDRLYGGEASGTTTITDAWTVDANGVLTTAPGSPFHSTGTNSNDLRLSPDNTLLFESNQSSASVNSFNLNLDGSLSNVGKFGGTGAVHVPAGMATDAGGRFLYIADDNFGVAVFRINAGGLLTPLSDIAINRPGEIQDLAAYPPRSCASADLSITKSASATVVAGSPIVYTLSITNNGPSAASAVISDTVPAGTNPGGNLKIVAATGAQRASGVVTIHTTAPHNAFVGETVVITGVGDTSFNGTFSVASIVDAQAFTYNQTGADLTSGGGTATTPNCQIPVGGTGVCGGAPLTARSIPIMASTGAKRVSGVVTITTTAPHVLLAGQTVTILGVLNSTFNGTFPIVSVPSPTTFTYTQTGADATSGGGNTVTGQTLTVSFASLANGETQTAILTATTSATAANGTVISNTAIIGNKSAVDAVPGNNFATAAVTVGTPATTAITIPNGTGPYGGLATLSAVLKNSVTNAPIAGKTLTFQLDGNLASAVTDATGTATVNSLPLGTITVGTHPSAFTVSFGGDSSFLASSAVGTLVVTKAQLTVTADNQSRLYGDANPPLTYTITGFVNGDTIAVVSGTADCSTTATPASPAGSYPITCTAGTLAATNYVFVFVDGALTVNPAPLSVTVDSASRAYGAANPTFTGTITGLKNGDVVTATYSTTATPASPVGTYPIIATLVDPNNVLGNYAVTNNPGTLTVTAAALVVTADNAARVYGDPNPAFTGTIAGLLNGDNITATFTTTATPASPVGNYPITPVLSDPTNKLGNYTVTLNNGTLVISPAPLTVIAADATRPYGTANPVFTGSIVGIKNGDNITATYNSPATITSPAGTYPIIPTLLDPTSKLSNYAVTSVNGRLTISAAVLTVTANNASRVYGDPNPPFTGIITGILNGDNITATYASVATPASPVGTYAIVPTLSDNGTGTLASYTVVINNGVLTVNPAPLTVTVDSFSRVYGDPNPVFTGTIVGIKNGDAITATFGSTADPTSAVGTYPIVATLLDPATKLGNYTVTSSNGTLTITAAALSVTAADASRLFGTPNPPFSGIITGIKNSDPISATYSTTAVTTSPAGTYPITPTLADPASKLGNYLVTSNNGTLTISAAPTANFLFVNNQAATGNSISGYSVAADGSLTQLASSPTTTGGLGANAACSSVNRLVLSNNLLFVSNGGDQTISAFQIDPTSGGLTAAAGSPFASGLTLDACSGISLAASPGGRFLMASSNGQIKTFAIGAGGALTPLFTAANSVVPNAGMKISANGQFLAVSNGVSASVYTINPDGSLGAVAGSPFAETGTGSLAGLDFSSTSGLLFGAESSPTAALADAWSISTGGVLSAISGSPFSTTAVNSNVVLLSPNDGFLFASNTGSSSVSSFSVAAGGGLSTIGSFGSAASLHAPVGMATDRSGSLLFVADDAFGVAVFRIDGAGSLAQLSDVAITGAGQVQSLVAYPPRIASNADLSVAVSASSPNVVAGQNVTYTITVTNNGADPAAATVTDSLPSGFTLVSCGATGNGACVGNSAAANFYLLQSGESQTVTLVTSTSLAIPDGTVTTNTASISNSSAVDPSTANNSASASVTVAQPAATTLGVAPASGTYGGSTTLSATLTTPNGPLSGETVNFTLNRSPAGSAVTDATGLASVPASLVGIAAGSYPGAVTASFAGDANNGAASGSAALTVNPALLTVAAASASRLYGDANPAFTGTITGIQNGENITATYASVATATSPVGSYPIVPTVSDNGTGALVNYTVVINNGTLTVNSALLTISAANASMVYGDPVAALSGTITGIKNGENITASYSTVATSASPVGSYAIVPAVSDNGTNVLANYTVVLNNGSLTITPAPLTVTAANTSMVFGDPVPVLSGTITGIKNADNITASYSTTATSASPIGSYSIVPALSDNGTGKLTNYTVTSVNGTLTITPAPLTVTAANASRFYGDPNPVFTGTITGLKNGDNITATYASAADVTSAPGTYAIVPTLVDPNGRLANYTVTVNNGVLTVNAAPLVVTAANASRFFGDANPVFTGTITGLKNGDNITATYSSTATAASPAGTYPIVPALVDPAGKLSNYAVTVNNGTLTISQAVLTVSAANASMIFGDPVPALSGTITGLKNGDTISATYSTTATSASPVGTYAIVPTLVDPNNQAVNYTVVINNGTLTISAASLTVTAANASRLYGDPNPAFTGTITGLKNGDNIGAVFSAAADPTSPVGTYAITPTLVDPNNRLGNYTVTLNNGAFVVDPAPLSVAADNASRLYGDPNPAFTGTLTGIRNGDNITATFASAADPTSPVGSYPIAPVLADPTSKLANYVVTSTNGTLTVTPAPLTIQAADATRLVGDPNPAFTGTIVGLKNNDVVTASYSTTADQTSVAGTYPIIPTPDSSPALGNYTITLVNGTLTVQ